MSEQPLAIELPVRFTTRQLVRFAGATEDFSEYHYDLRAARSIGLDSVLVHGQLEAGVLVAAIDEWAARLTPALRVVGVRSRYVARAHPAVDYTARLHLSPDGNVGEATGSLVGPDGEVIRLAARLGPLEVAWT